jgi:hypothetical protein
MNLRTPLQGYGAGKDAVLSLLQPDLKSKVQTISKRAR